VDVIEFFAKVARVTKNVIEIPRLPERPCASARLRQAMRGELLEIAHHGDQPAAVWGEKHVHVVRHHHIGKQQQGAGSALFREGLEKRIALGRGQRGLRASNVGCDKENAVAILKAAQPAHVRILARRVYEPRWLRVGRFV